MTDRKSSVETRMLKLTDSLRSWGTPDFNDVIKQEIQQLDAMRLPLQQGMSQGNYTSGKDITVLVLNVTDDVGYIHVKSGVFYTGMITGCSCADDPTPIDEHTEYCEILFDINKTTAETAVTLLPG